MGQKIGVLVESFRTDVYEGLKRAKHAGAAGVQISTVRGDMAAWDMPAQKVKDVLAAVKANGLEVSALCGDLGGHGFMDKALNADKIEKSKRIIDLAKQWECNIVTTHIGVLPQDVNSEVYAVMQTACRELAEYASANNAFFALETGAESCDALKVFLDSLGSKGLSVNFDPANLVMVMRDDPVKGVYTLKDYIVHTHAKDGVNLVPATAEEVYGSFSHGDDAEVIEYFKETPLGEGNVPFKEYLQALTDIGYNGYLTIEREVGDDPSKDIFAAVEFLQKLLA